MGKNGVHRFRYTQYICKMLRFLNKMSHYFFLQLFGDAMCKYSEDCPNAIVHASLIPKQDIQVMWKAPPPGTGCVVFK
ncbi:UNVERIFIED_CONTAM: hypothetical protein NCL1_04024 [Trichonephila clavipes]